MISKTQRAVVINASLTATVGGNAGTDNGNGQPSITIVGDEVCGYIEIATGNNPDGNIVGTIHFPESLNYETENLMVEVFPLRRIDTAFNFKGESANSEGFELVANALEGNQSYKVGYRVTEFKTSQP